MSHKQSVWSVFKRAFLSGLVTVAILCVFSASILAQDTSTSAQEDEQLIKVKRRLPMLNGHNFIPSSNLKPTPFVTTFFRNTTGVGNAIGQEIPLYDEGGEIIETLNANITYMVLELTYQQAVNDWLAFWISGSGIGRIGTNAESILSAGISAVGAIELGGLARIWSNDKMILSAAASVRRNKLIGVDIIGFAESIIDTGIIDTDNLYKSIPSTRWKGGLRYAFAPNDLWGILAFLDFGSGENLAGEDKNDTVFEIGGLISLDLNTRTVVPIGFVLGYRHTSYPEGSGDLVERAGNTTLKIAYTGRREFSLGLEGGYVSAPIVDTDKSLNYGSIAFNLQYFF
jgi:hypothetical protein